MSKVFLYKENTENRDCCAYIESNPMRFECGHYFGGVTLMGACYCHHDFPNYDDVRTVLTKEEYNQLIAFNILIRALGSGIKKGDDRYNKGVELCKGIQPVFDRLLSYDNEEFFEKIQEEEKQYMMHEYNLSKADIECIFNEYYLEYRDRGIISYVFADDYECGYEEACNCGYITNGNTVQERYFDFKQFGEDLADDDKRFLRLNDERIVCLNC